MTKEIEISSNSNLLAEKVTELGVASGADPFIFGLTAFILACFVGYFVVWKVTPALHTPLMSVTNAVSGVIVVGAIIALGSSNSLTIAIISFSAIILASINIFGGFVVTWRMLDMFKSKSTAKK
ncbi:MAG: NAD(P) transhydrogenase subunit alpha [Lentimonas sp.]|jgi:NAD(P) transhydrogenase subunit alpha